MKTLQVHFGAVRMAFAVLVLLAATGCETRSLSNSGYHGGARYGADRNPFYRGELNEFDVLGIEHDQTVSEEQIRRALDSASPLRIKRASSILLIQSGALFPDDPMVQELNKYFKVTPFSGIPGSGGANSYARTLRLVAARGGHETIVCYWGILESARKNLTTKQVSWVPLVGWTIPDESQQMRIRLKIAVIDVRTGNWSMFYSNPFEDKAVSGRYSRKDSDQKQVFALKERSYLATAQDLVKIYAN